MNKFLAILICGCLLLSAMGCSFPSQDQSQESQNQLQTPQEPPQKSYEEQKALYDDTISQYTALLTSKQKGESLFAPSAEYMSPREIAISEALYGIVSLCADAQAAEKLGYGYKDLDGNGTPELILLTKHFKISAIFTISDDLPILLEANYGAGTAFYFAANNRFLMSRSSVNNNIEEATFYTCRVSGNTMVYDTVYGKVYDQDKKEILEYFQLVDNNRVSISKDTFNELSREQKKTVNLGYRDISKRFAPFIHYPLRETHTNKNLPIADFSSYATIRETCQKIATCSEQFNRYNWIAGEYDDLFAYPNDVSFEYYTQLLLGTSYSLAMGYDEIDLNGDTQNELVLLDEDYRIKAIFTQKDGVPVLLDAFASETCWLDDQGLIHVDNEQYQELEYSLYEFTIKGEYNLVYSILVADNGNRYLTRDGKTEKITFEASLELYNDDYCRYSEPFEPHEQTRNSSDLTYTPLSPSTEDQLHAATAQTWHKNANLKKTSGKELAYGDTYITFKDETDSQLTISLKYVFTFSYPDPQKDNYFLNHSTESILEITACKEGNRLVFEESGIKGTVDFGHNSLWLILEESSDQRFPVGHHFYQPYDPQDFIS